MKRALLLLVTFTILLSCTDKEVDPSKLVRPVGLRIAVSNGNYNLTWEEYRIVCITSPCPDVANTEAEEYEIQIASSELGPFKTYRTVKADQKSISVPVAAQGAQLVARIVSKAEGAPDVNSNAVMVSSGPLSQSAFYPAFGTSEYVAGGDVSVDGKWALYTVFDQNSPGQSDFALYLARLENEKEVAVKRIGKQVSGGRFSPDAKQLAYYSYAENGFVIYDIASEQKRVIPGVPAAQQYGLAWSPDGKWLGFSTVSEQTSRLWKVSTAGGSAIPLTPELPASELNGIRQAELDWSPDNTSIAISRARSEGGGKDYRVAITFYSPEGTGESRYFETQPGWIDTNPSFSPVGKQVAFLSTRTDPISFTYSLWMRDVATGKVRQIGLLPGLIPSPDYQPRWQGTNKLIFMGSQQGKRGYFSVIVAP
ncbi:TolB family protein [Dyadobacter sp.]|uniref:TolB family protein n=1 Tax=Dyadobacter sp. TaxID=1914288 RepID=UPI003F6ED953